MWPVFAQVLNVLKRIGTPNPTASGTATVFQYLCKVDWASKQPRGAEYTFQAITASSTVTVLSITGAGFFLGLQLCANGVDVSYGIEVDGVKILDKTVRSVYTNTSASISGPLRFNSSLKIYLCNNSGSTTYNAGMKVLYCLD